MEGPSNKLSGPLGTMGTITEYLAQRGFRLTEGFSQLNPAQTQDLKSLVSYVSEKSQLSEKADEPLRPLQIMEIGFHAGHSAETFLSTNLRVNLTSFDIGEYPYVRPAGDFIQMKFPGRHTLVIGNSLQTVPQFSTTNPDKKFDLIFIDGGHDYPVAQGDIRNCRKLAHKDTIVVLDDTIYTPSWERFWTVGPTRAWTEALEWGVVTELGRRDYREGMGMSWGRYNL